MALSGRRVFRSWGIGLVVLVSAVASLLTVGFVQVSTSHARAGSRTATIAFLRWSPDAWKDGAGGPALFAIGADGRSLRRLTPPGVLGYAWSPDGSRIAYHDSRGSLWMVRRDGTGRTRVWPSASRLWCVGVAWSPDGKELAVAAGWPPPKGTFRPPPLRIFVVPTEGGAPRRLSSGEATSPAWSPQGDEIAYDTGGGGIRRISSSGGKAQWVVGWTRERRTGFGGPQWSPDGTLLAVNATIHRAGFDQIYRYAGIAVVRPDRTGLHYVTTHAYNEYGFAWSPDSRQILYGRENREGIYVIDADGRNDHRVTRDSPRPIAWGALAWSPDGRSIAYATNRTGSGDIYLIDSDGHNKAQLTNSPDIDVAPSWVAR